MELARIPPGLHFDEAVYGLMARDILAGARPVFFPAYTGREPLYMYLMALVMTIAGSTAYAIRLTSALAGILTVALSYALGRALYGRRAGLAAATLVATNYWHLTVSRNGYPNILIPPLAAASVWFLLRGWRRRSASAWLLGGALSGLILYTYLAARLWPVFLAVLALYGVWRFPGQRRRLAGGMVLATLAGALVVAPLACHFARQPADFWQRANQVLGWQEYGRRELLSAYGQNLVQTVTGFVRHGDPRWHYNLPGRPVFEPWLASLAVVGLLVCLRHWRSPRHGLAVLWVAVMVLPGVLTMEMQPASQRLFGVFPAIVFLPALGLTEGLPLLLRHLARAAAACQPRGANHGRAGTTAAPEARRRGQRLRGATIGRWLAASEPYLVGAASLLAGVAVGLNTVGDYFGDWARQPETAHIFHADYVAMAEAAQRDVAAGRPTVLLSEHYRHPTVAFLAPQLVENVVWCDPRQALPLPRPLANTGDARQAADRKVVYYRPVSILPDEAPAAAWLVREAEASSPVPAVLPGGLPFQASDAMVRQPGRPRIEVIRYVVPWREHWRPRSGGPSVGDELQLRPAIRRLTVQRDEVLEVPFEWRVHALPAGDRHFAVHLRDATGLTWAQADGAAYLANEWRPGDQVWAWFRLGLDRAMPPGAYRALLVVSDGQGRGLPVRFAGRARETWPLAWVRVDDDGRQRLPVGAAVEYRLGNGLAVVSTTVSPDAVAPGDWLTAEILWLRDGPVDGGESVTFAWRDLGRSGVLPPLPLAAGYPPQRWADRELLRGRYRVRAAASLGAGRHELVARVAGSSRSFAVGEAAVRPAQRQLARPTAIGQPLNAEFDQAVRLMGCDVRLGRRATDALTVTLTWQSLQESPPEAKVFVHLYDADGRLVSQHDAPPADGSRPLPGWIRGEYVTDRHVLHLPGDLAAGRYAIAVGLYDGETGRRWTLDCPCPVLGENALRLPLWLRWHGGFGVVEGADEGD